LRRKNENPDQEVVQNEADLDLENDLGQNVLDPERGRTQSDPDLDPNHDPKDPEHIPAPGQGLENDHAPIPQVKKLQRAEKIRKNLDHGRNQNRGRKRKVLVRGHVIDPALSERGHVIDPRIQRVLRNDQNAPDQNRKNDRNRRGVDQSRKVRKILKGIQSPGRNRGRNHVTRTQKYRRNQNRKMGEKILFKKVRKRKKFRKKATRNRKNQKQKIKQKKEKLEKNHQKKLRKLPRKQQKMARKKFRKRQRTKRIKKEKK
jgi:hypothetical protein